MAKVTFLDNSKESNVGQFLAIEEDSKNNNEHGLRINS